MIYYIFILYIIYFIFILYMIYYDVFCVTKKFGRKSGEGDVGQLAPLHNDCSDDDDEDDDVEEED